MTRLLKLKISGRRGKQYTSPVTLGGSHNFPVTLGGRHNRIIERKNKYRLSDEFCINDDPLTIANAFNNYFTNIGTELENDVVPNDDFRGYLPEYSFKLRSIIA